MSTMSLRVIARVAAKADRVDQVRAILIGVVEPTRREPGCLGYQLLQNQADPTDFTFIEECTSAAAEQSHFATPHISHALRQLPELLATEPDVRRYHSIEMIPMGQAAEGSDMRGRSGSP